MAYEFIDETDNLLQFRITEIDKSMANAIRRTLIGNIPIVVCKTKDCIITKNTTRFNNEIIKHRLSCIPIYMENPHMSSSLVHETELSKVPFTIEISKINATSEMVYITTADFTVKHGDDYLSKAEVHAMFPPNNITGDFIEFLRLRPKFGDAVEELVITCILSIGMGSESGAFNSVGTCAYGCTHDEEASSRAWETIHANKNRMEESNWKLLDAKRYVKLNSFDFKIETVGVYSNINLFKKSLAILQLQLHRLPEITIEPSTTTMKNCVDIIMTNGDYTLGKILEYQIYTTEFKKSVTFISFLKVHPHDTNGILRVATTQPQSPEEIHTLYKAAARGCIEILEAIKSSVK